MSPTETQAIPTAISDSISLTNNQVSLSAQDLGTFTFYIIGKTHGGAQSYQTVTTTFECGPTSSTVGLISQSTATSTFNKNSGVQAVLSDVQTKALFTSSSELCPPTTFELRDSSDQPITSTSSLFTVFGLQSRNDAAINVDTAIAMTDGTVTEVTYSFKVVATSGTNSASKDVSVTISICGSETISAMDATPFVQTIDIDPSASA